MSKYQRTKGAGYEREIVTALRETLGVDARRNLSQTRDSGADILLGKFVFECKRRASISIYQWMDQAEDSCNINQVPIVVCRGDGRESLVILNLTDFLPLLGNELTPTTQNVSSCQQEPS